MEEGHLAGPRRPACRHRGLPRASWRALMSVGVPTRGVSWAHFCCLAAIKPIHRVQKGRSVTHRYQSQLHRRSSRRGEFMRLGLGPWCLFHEPNAEGIRQRVTVGSDLPQGTFAKATDAVSDPTTRTASPGGVAERFKAPVSATGTRKGMEGSIPSSTTEHGARAPHLHSDRVAQRRRAGQRTNRPAPPSAQPQHAAVGRWPAGLCRGAEPPGS
jgi:hypothetical protein